MVADGAELTGEDLVSGAWNGAQDQTLLIGDGSGSNFTDGILKVMPSPDPNGSPTRPTNGIAAYGCAGGNGIYARGALPDRPTGGAGVLGEGGTSNIEATEPGAGIVGIGGQWVGLNGGRLGGAGVVALASGFNLTEKVLGHGVHARGAIGVVGSGQATQATGGPLDIKKGLPGTGVFGTGSLIGVAGFGATGVFGHGTLNHAGWFECEVQEKNIPQIHIEPQDMNVRVSLSEKENAQAERILPAVVDRRLPAVARAGDLLVTNFPTGNFYADGKNGKRPIKEAVLWFCVLSSNPDLGGGPAHWRQVLLGPPIRGGP